MRCVVSHMTQMKGTKKCTRSGKENMSRYVDIDLLIARLKEHSPQTSKVKVAQIVTKGVPVIDIVRCKKCKHKDKYCDYCHELDVNIKPDNFCSYGERREHDE